MLNKLGIALYFLFWAAAIVVMFALVAGLFYLVAIDQYPISWNLVSGSLFFIILAVIFWVCAQVSRYYLAEAGSPPPDSNAS
ncbi:hypothetical protein [Billgrantia kenyensis]|uniref:Uncharacterized protein n=1 Tax=Billgrantia kenyensis TaxID=321266 RepID=A0A7V9W255_9GAMM|nr:hypothetical protein [Halomonas kenyensis]MBA2779657.1 hypothetical protein [Halomonas kenyensis]MCG6662658.1 hypothetical protein [Halomonas kenyensis]